MTVEGGHLANDRLNIAQKQTWTGTPGPERNNSHNKNIRGSVRNAQTYQRTRPVICSQSRPLRG
jgi:hypothetical protein